MESAIESNHTVFNRILITISMCSGCQRVGMPGLGSRLSTCCPTKRSKWRCSQHTSADQTPIPCVPVASPGLKPKGGRGGGVCEERTLRRSQTGQAQLGLSCKASKCSDAGTGDLSVLPAHETSPMNRLVMPAQPDPGEFRRKQASV